MVELKQFLVAPATSISEVMSCIDRNGKGIALVVDPEHRLIGTVTDGDIRHAILAGMNLSGMITELLDCKADSPYAHPITATAGTSYTELLRLMRKHVIRHIPLVDANGYVVDLVTSEELLSYNTLPVRAVIMAGGYGKRLQPLTNETPKPMLHVGGRPIIEWVIEGLRRAGIHHITVTVCYKAELITQYFGDGRNFGVQIEYIHENELSGTAGALALLPPWHQPLLVINGDILTRVNFQAMLYYNQEHKADMTVAVREYHFQVPYGTVEIENTRIKRLSEKPSLRFFVNAGIYLLEPFVQSYITKGKFLDMTDLILHLLADSRSVIGFPIREYWIDVGQHADYEQAKADMMNGGLF